MKKMLMMFVLAGFLFTVSGLALAEDTPAAAPAAGSSSSPAVAQNQGAPTKEWVLHKRHDRLERKIARLKQRREKMASAGAPQDKLAKIDARIAKLQANLDDINGKLASAK